MSNNFTALIIPKLLWSNFQGLPELQSAFDACLRWGIYYSFQVKHEEKMPRVILDVTISIGEDSWYIKGKETDDLLTHENGHYTIAHLFGYKFKDLVNFHSFNSKVDLDSSIQKMFDRTFRDCMDYQNFYDKETNHSLNKAIQRRWNNHLEDLVNEYNSGPHVHPNLHEKLYPCHSLL